MKKRLLCLLLLTSLACSLCACAGKDPHEAPAVPAAADLATAARTSACRMAETENGYYMEQGQMLYYADKADLSNWVLLCNAPDCDHRGSACPASINRDWFRILGSRIYSLRNTIELDKQAKAALAIYSTALDGTDLRMEYPLEQFPSDAGYGLEDAMTADALYLSGLVMEKNGLFRTMLLRLNEDGVHTIYEADASDLFVPTFFSGAKFECIQGDFCARSLLLSGNEEFNQHMYRFTGDQYAEIPHICDYDISGAYLSGNTLYRFEPGNGYYRTDLTSNKSKKWMDAEFSESRAYILAPDFLIETTSFYQSSAATPEMRIWCSGSWQDVSFEGITLPADSSISLLARTTAHVFFTAWDRETYGTMLYCIALEHDSLRAEYCTTFAVNT